MIIKILKTALIGIVWSYLFFYYANVLFLYFWGFDMLTSSSWQRISAFWNHGGIIRAGKDYGFLFTLLLVPFIWIYGWRKLYRFHFVKLLTWPFEAYNRHIIKKYGGQSGKRILLKNIGASSSIEETIKTAVSAVKPNPEQDADKIRMAIKEKLNKTKPKN